ncbi:Glu-tRNA(Gln) amidotransferase subunit GatE [Candidatus Woesearchaeota archaeon]|nr:Glu-tRNA(Gln) amidotransferase subunit GatE [Candidatus Woesearchaeota archaeon]
MTTDYATLGLKAGLEIHQQLDTRCKLFCNCPTAVRDDKADVVVKRRLRASAGETGEMDVAAAYEQLRGKYFLYQAYNDTVCDVELDEEPVHQMNNEALQVAMQVSEMLKAKPVDRIQVMRKTVVDGSNTSGFQRTALVARNGSISASGKTIGVSTVCIEEESAKIAERKPDCDTYNLSRLGIPLVEIATSADIKSPEEAKDVAEYLGMILRSTGKVKRGLGTIRQDVNVSIRDGARVEIKGVQELRLLPKLVEYEAMRQKGLVELAAELKAGNASANGKIEDVTELLGSCNSEITKSVIAKGGIAVAAKLAGFKGLIGKEFAGVPGRRLGKELSEHARAYAGVGGVLHTDELPKYGITEGDIDKINKALGCGSNDAFVLVAAEKEKAEAAIKVVIERARQAIKGVASEVRNANEDGTTTFLRPMPGSARMYPETDIPLVNPGQLGKIRLPVLLIEKAADYQNLGLTADIARAIAYSDHALLFESLSKACKKLNAAYIADILLSYRKQLLAEGVPAGDADKIGEEELNETILAVERGKIAKESVVKVLAEAAQSGKLDISRHSLMTDSELEQELKAIVAENKAMPLNALIGKAMERLRGKAPGQKIVEKLKSLAK